MAAELEVVRKWQMYTKATVKVETTIENVTGTMENDSRHLRKESAHDSAVYAHKDDLTRLICLDDPSEHADQKAHNQYQRHSDATIAIEVGKKSQW